MGSPSSKGLHRRRFLKVVGQTGALGVATVCLSNCGAHILVQNRRPQVLVLGSGLAGLSAARLLEQAGISVQVIEARQRVGGRVHTISGYPGLVEEGGQLVGESYTRLLKLVKEMGLEAKAPGGRGGRPRSLFFLGGTPWQEKRWAEGVKGLHAEEKGLPPAALMSRYLAQGNPLTDLHDWTRAPATEWDQLSVADLLRRRGASEAALELMNLAPNCNGLETASALWALRDHHRRRSAEGGLRVIEGGNGRLPTALAQSLKNPVDFGRVVRSIGANPAGLEVRCADGSHYEAEYVLCTIPFSVLRQIEIDPPLQGEQAAAVAELPYTQISKIFLQATEPFWQADGQPPGMWTDTVLERLFPLHGADGEVWGLLAWIDGPNATLLAQMTPDERQKVVLEEMARMRPASRGKLRWVHGALWPSDPYALGAYHHFGVGQVSRFAKAMARPSGRLHFAGEHTALTSPGMEGAVESGERAAEEILAKVRPS